MADLSKRQYLKYAGASLAALSLGVGGKLAADGTLQSSVKETTEVAPAAKPGTDAAPEPILGPASYGDILDYERDDYGNIEFDWAYLSFESDDGDIDLDDVGVDFETDLDSDFLELTVEDSEVYVDLEMDDNGHHVELDIAFRNEYISFEYDDGDVEFESDGQGHQFEDDRRDIEYRGRFLDFEFDEDSEELEIKGAIKLELEMDNGLDFEYADGRIAIDFDTTELEYAGEDVLMEWEWHNGDDEFEARRL
ncbi:hypothetical protein [Haloarchaeobius sp. HME9146]|uniref:hypothetical protein n=1 Tax=Haloarchaeobius sp. HME9146 TaxID=2978732 RepID=UPI0021C03A73|nr:hypothetical protein [Haloarchaeobius sp. HME9146]MCT9098375.1 hypothetical protein [Haloarchaeobius sp. HME9146]